MHLSPKAWKKDIDAIRVDPKLIECTRDVKRSVARSGKISNELPNTMKAEEFFY
jgi:hypothetical protein